MREMEEHLMCSCKCLPGTVLSINRSKLNHTKKINLFQHSNYVTIINVINSSGNNNKQIALPEDIL